MKFKNQHYKILAGFLFAVSALWLSPELHAQDGKYGATPEDSIKCIENLSIYKDFLAEKNYEKAYSYWKVPFGICPQSSLKMYVDGEDILEGLIEKYKDNAARKKQLLDTLLLSFDTRIKYFDKEGYVLGKKGTAIYKYGYPGYEEAFETLMKSIELDGNEAQPAAMIYGFQAALRIHKKDPKPADFWIDLFNKCVAICEYNIANHQDQRMVAAYKTTMDNVIKLADPFLTCEVLIKHFKAKYEEKKADVAWLEKAAKFLGDKDCSEDPLFFKIANTLHSMNPSSESAKSMAIMSMKKSNFNDAVKFFTQAIELAEKATDNPQKNEDLAQLELYLAKAYFGQGNNSAARSHAQKAASYKSNWGEPYMFIGDIYTGSVNQCTETPDKELKAPYWLAVDMYMKAKSVDGSIANEASQKIAKFSQYFPEKKDAFFHGVTEGSDYTVKCWINATTKARFR